jgi:hypothetical protein
MWIFGHLGFGAKIAQPFARRLPVAWLLAGTVLPDFIDKPLYYFSALATGRHGFEIGLISCTRTLGHTAIFALALAGLAFVRKSKPLAALALGVATHLAIDGFQDFWFHRVEGHDGESAAVVAILFPFYLPRFSAMPFATFADHLKSGAQPFLLISESIGFLLFAWTVWKERRRIRLAVVRTGSALRKSRSDR